ncbi:MAG TPA: helix-turn-helix transcriptional regulator [Clostridiales bacterium]|jgi:DNA-binding HxlR family transcriptional regulator|nr:helix-turn-helix transcriptional regulator [Clostridiales bacterium]
MKSRFIGGLSIVENLIKLRWVPEILGSIELGNRNYSEILRSIPYLSHTELNRKLKILIEKDVIKRVEEGNNTYYTLLDFGRDLVHIFRHLEDLEEKYCKNVR